MNEKEFALDEDSGLGSEVELLSEMLLSALRLRDGQALKTTADRASEAARIARADLVRDGVKRDLRSYQLGVNELLESIAVRAADRHDRNSLFEAARYKYARHLLVETGLAPKGTATPTYLLDRLQAVIRTQAQDKESGSELGLPAVSRLIRRLLDAELLVRVTDGDPHPDGAKSKPVRLTPNGFLVLDHINPGWRDEGAYSIDPRFTRESDEMEETLPTASGTPAKFEESGAVLLGDLAILRNESGKSSAEFVTSKTKTRSFAEQYREMLAEQRKVRYAGSFPKRPKGLRQAKLLRAQIAAAKNSSRRLNRGD